VRAGPPLVSVVTPVYNGEEYLAECIQSVLDQTYRDWEYLIVDNQSTDGTFDVANSFADDRIRIVRNEQHLPIISNWNHALRQISSESRYCKVVHADDLLFADCLEKMVVVAKRHPSVGVVGSLQLRGASVNLDGVIPYGTEVVSGREICRSTLTGGGFVFGTPTTVLIRADLVRARESFYNEENLHADTEACFDVLRESDFGFVHQVLSYTRPHDASMTRTVASRLNTFSAGRLITLTKYGPVYLERKEYQRRLAGQIVRYGLFLFRPSVALKVREARFRRLHSQSLRRLRNSVAASDVLRGGLHELSARLNRTSR
jgi:glycosyltransferase involved in cell wall biosynthesis